jgi:hypothetical protein
VLDLDGGSNLSLAGQDHPTIFDPQPERSHDGGE